jgi:hypothetical protein
MKSGPLTITAMALVLSSLWLSPTVASASAGPLLSGYGGPGEGNQAVLGSALLNGPSGKGGSGSGGGGSTGGGLVAASSQTTGAAGGESVGAKRSSEASGGGAGHSSGSAPSGKHLKRSAGQASTGGSQPYIGTYSPTASHPTNGGSQTLGLSGADLAYILLALAMLLLTGLMTRRLARANSWGRGGGSSDATQNPTN